MLTDEKVTKIIGKDFADKLNEYVINISPQLSFTRRQMIEDLGCANFLAAYRLQKVLKRLKITTAKQLFNTDPFSLLRCKGIGNAAIFVAMCIIDKHRFSVEKWWMWHESNPVKFSTYKSRAVHKRRVKVEV